MINFIEKLELGSKAETLSRLSKFLKKSSVPSLLSFTVEDWQSQTKSHIEKIKSFFNGKKVIVRSSALAEDTLSNAMAGAFLSLGNVDSNKDNDIKIAVNNVINSYSKDSRDIMLNDQVLVQVMMQNVSMSGVVFTQDMNNGAPYYVINYDDETGLTDTVASGYCNRTLYVHRDATLNLRSERIKTLIEAVNEIEVLLDCDTLDIEFSIDNQNQVSLFQVRAITTKPNWNRGASLMVNDAIRRLKSDFISRSTSISGLVGRRTILGRMPDWNPAEMIGEKPRPLALSLYRKLITDKVWRLAREKMGYQVPAGMPLMVSYVGQPFIDVRLSFHSFLPLGLNSIISNKLVNAWLDHLEKNIHLHDKVEFDVATTILDLDFENIFKNRYPNLLNETELLEYRQALETLSFQLVNGEKASIEEQYEKLEKLESNRLKIIDSQNEWNITRVSSLLEDCIEYGTIPFSILARHGFIAKTLLDGMISYGVINKKEADAFLKSIPTVATEMLEDMALLQNEKFKRSEFISKYGHLRPGAYNILSSRYDDLDNFITGLSENQDNVEQISKDNKFNFSAHSMNSIELFLKENGYNLSSDEFIEYVKKAIQGREYGKFIFTKNLSEVLEIISNWGERLGLTKEELSFLEIDEILDTLVVADGRNLEGHLRSFSEHKSRKYLVTSSIRLPHLICSPTDIEIIPLMLDQPNFIGDKSVKGEALMLDDIEGNSILVSNKIIVIESADPGYDWLFSKNIKGLITKFGGANSHMAIRCAEFGLPAAIGCGEQIFDRVTKAKYIELNCTDHKVTPIEGLQF